MAKDSEIEYKLRPMVEDDVALIYNSFLMSYRKSWPACLIPNRLYYKVFHDYLENRLEDCRCVVAHEADDESVICGWIIGRPDDIVYVYVKELWRGYGVATTLVDGMLTGDPRVRYRLFTGAGAGLMARYNIDWDLVPLTEEHSARSAGKEAVDSFEK